MASKKRPRSGKTLFQESLHQRNYVVWFHSLTDLEKRRYVTYHTKQMTKLMNLIKRNLGVSLLDVAENFERLGRLLVKSSSEGLRVVRR